MWRSGMWHEPHLQYLWTLLLSSPSVSSHLSKTLVDRGWQTDTDVLFPSQIKASPSWWLLTATAHCSRCVFCNLATVRLPELNGGVRRPPMSASPWLRSVTLQGCRTRGPLAWILRLLHWLIDGSVDGLGIYINDSIFDLKESRSVLFFLFVSYSE